MSDKYCRQTSERNQDGTYLVQQSHDVLVRNVLLLGTQLSSGNQNAKQNADRARNVSLFPVNEVQYALHQFAPVALFMVLGMTEIRFEVVSGRIGGIVTAAVASVPAW